MNKLSLALIIVINTHALIGMEVKKIKPSPITLAKNYYYFAHDLLMPEIAQHIFFFHLGNVDPKELPDKIEQSCKDPESLVEYINTLINSCGSLLASELCVQLFLYKKISILNIKTLHWKETYLHLAVEKDYPIVIQVLLKIADNKAWEFLTMKDTRNQTALHYAAYHNKIECIKILLNAAGNQTQTLLTMKNVSGWTALHYAAYENKTESVELLLNAAGDNAQTLLTMKNNKNETAFDLANPKTREIIQKYMPTNQCHIF